MIRPPGLRPERTTLARQRTALSAWAVAALLLRVGAAHHGPLVVVAGTLTALGAAVTSWYARDPATPPPPGRLRVISATFTVAAVLALVHVVA